MVGRLLHDVGAAGLRPLEDGVEVGGGQHDACVGALGHHLGDDAALVVGDAGVGGGRRQHDVHIGPARGADGDPAHGVAADVLADLEAQRIAVEGQGLLGIFVGKETRVDRDVHAVHARCSRVAGASRFLTGLVTCFSTHDGIACVAPAVSSR